MTSTIPHTAPELKDAPSEASVNLAIGRRLRRRRRLLGLTQTDLARALGIQFQQVQKYECSASRISASRLYLLAAILKVPVDYFFDQLPATTPACTLEKGRVGDVVSDLLMEKETLNLLNSYARLPVPVRQRLRTFAKALGDVIGDRQALGGAP